MTTESPSMKSQAEEIMTSVEHDLQQVADSQTPATLEEVNARTNTALNNLFNIIQDVDLEAAAERVDKLREKYPAVPSEALAQKLIRDKCQQTGTVGAVTSGAALIPGLGSAAALTVGVAADIGATFKLQAELVLEIAAVYNYPLTDDEKQRIVMVVTGIGVGTTALAYKAGQRVALKMSEKVAQKVMVKAIPVIGVIASAGTNVLSTYIIGQRADAYFRLGPEAVGSWADTLRTISGVDERRITRWMADGGKATGTALVAGAGKVGQAGKAAGEAVAGGAGRMAGTVGPAISTGAQKAGQTAQTGFKWYLWWLVTFWTTFFRAIGAILKFLWNVLTFIPRKIAGLFSRKERPKQ